MPFAYDEPNREVSVASHDSEAIEAGSTERDLEAAKGLIRDFVAPAGLWLDIGCGSGRHLRALHAAGFACAGVDVDPRMLAAARQGLPESVALYEADFARAELPLAAASVAICTLWNRGLVLFHSHALATGLFRQAARLLAPGGLFILDNCCAELWDQIRSGDLADGMSLDGSEQLFFLPGENRFIWRRGAQVDPHVWQVKPDDRLYRCWSLNEVALAAEGAGLALARLAPDSRCLALQKSGA